MRGRALVVAVAAFCALAASGCGSAPHGGAPSGRSASAVLNVRPELDASARRADLRRALPLVSASASALGYKVLLAPRRDPVLRALTDTTARTITLFLARDDAPHRTAHDLAHEIGHAFDAVHMTPAARSGYLRRRGVPAATWWPHNGRADYSVGAGDFAEVYALCHAASPEFRSRLAPRPADPCAVLPAGAAQ
jgi:hypothetical protein